jgi:hypothetical protein
VKFVFRQIFNFITAYLEGSNPMHKLQSDYIWTGRDVEFRIVCDERGHNDGIAARFEPAVEVGSAPNERYISTIRLYPSTWESKVSLRDFHQLRVEPFADFISSRNAAGTLIHELAHLVGAFCAQSFLGKVGFCQSDLPEPLHHGLFYTRFYSLSITDIDILDFATPEETKVLTDHGCSEWNLGTKAYGKTKCKLLPHLQKGAHGAFLNGDSYSQMAIEINMQYLGGVYEKLYRTDPAAQKATADVSTALARMHRQWINPLKGVLHVKYSTHFDRFKAKYSQETIQWYESMRRDVDHLLKHRPLPEVNLLASWAYTPPYYVIHAAKGGPFFTARENDPVSELVLPLREANRKLTPNERKNGVDDEVGAEGRCPTQ